MDKRSQFKICKAKYYELRKGIQEILQRTIRVSQIQEKRQILSLIHILNLLHARRVSALYATRNFDLYYREYVTKEDTLEALRKERKLPEFSDREISEDWANSYLSLIHI